MSDERLAAYLDELTAGMSRGERKGYDPPIAADVAMRALKARFPEVIIDVAEAAK